jgi:CMP-N,N'-diacetyllegionaminic acid synthase
MKVLGVIPARGGSKGIRGKNLAPLGNRPLLFYTCREARKARTLDRIIVSTDDRKIARIARKFGIAVPFLRPKVLAGDRAPMVSVLKHALAEMATNEKFAADVVVVLQPTSPFRRAAHIDQTVRALVKSRAQAAVTVVDVPHNMSPESALRIRSGVLTSIRKGAPALRRQDKKEFVARNGPAVLAVRSALIRKGKLYGTKTAGVRMGKLESLDIDGPDDLVLARALFASGKAFR